MNKKSSAFLTMGTLTLLAGGGVVLTNLPDSFKIERVYAATSRQVIVLPTDFLTNFQRNGSAARFDYDLTTYTQTLTPNQASQAGNVTLKTKVDMSQNFTFTGEINFGDKAQNAGGTGDSSNYTTSADIKSYTDAGYELVSDNYPSGGTVFTNTAQHYVVNLKQKLVVSSEQKQVNETIQYVYEDGSKAADDYNAPPLNFTRSVTTNQVTGEKTYGDWQAQNGDSFGEVVSPTIKGETADQLKIDAISGITANSADIQKKVIYKRNQGTIDVTYIDETTGQVLTKKDLSGGTDDPSNYTTADDIKSYTAKGYELVSDDYPSGGQSLRMSHNTM